MAESNIARPHNASVARKRYAPMAFRPANAPRPFRRGDLALVMGNDASIKGQLVVVCTSDRGADGSNPEIAIQFTRGDHGLVRASSLQLVAAVDAHEYGPACEDLLNFIGGRGPVGQQDAQ